ncbi:MAG: GNAT family N-acetyltransferase [Bacteroidales bacterium]
MQSTGFFEQSPDEIDIAIELAEMALEQGNNIENYDFIMAEQDDQVVGYVCFSRVPCSISSFEIYWLCVDQRWQGNHIGKKLIEETIQIIRTCGGKKLILQTAGRTQYIPTQKFYSACGFIEEARIKDYYAEGDDCLIFTMGIN